MDEATINDIQNRLKVLEDAKEQKEVQQISLPLDEPSVRIIEEIIPTSEAPDLSGLVRFGGDGSDGDLTVASGTTTIDLGSLPVFIKNYTSISITGTGAVNFTSPAANGTIIILKSQGDVILTSTANPLIDLRSLGAVGGGAASSNSGVAGNPGLATFGSVGPGSGGTNSGTTGSGPAGTTAFNGIVYNNFLKLFMSACGAGGGSGGAGTISGGTSGGGGGGGASFINNGVAGNNASLNTTTANGSSGAGGRGGGALIIECAGALDSEGIIDARGAAGGNASGTGANGGGGGGGGGSILLLYNTLTTNSGTYTVTGGSGGSHTGSGLPEGGDGGKGGDGTSLIGAYEI